MGAEGIGAEGIGADGTGAAGAEAGDPARPETAGADPAGDGDRRWARTAPRKGSGRQRHDAKITVYVSGDELLAMEQARLTLRGAHDLVVDRGRIVREAVAVLLADFEENAEESVLVQRLRDTDEGTAGGAGDAGGTTP
nr:cobyrinic acid a,c-diamide synthase [Saccharomonospora iraqiensis]